jgi:thiamine biosynthesis lipoprotein
MRVATFIVALAVVPQFAEAAERARYLMGTVCEVAADDPEQIERAFAEAQRIEAMLSTWTEESELARVNRGETAPSPELRALLDETLVWSHKTNRAFDPRIGHLVRPRRVIPSGVEGPGRADGAPPARPDPSTSLGMTGGIEEGAFGKGYALDRMLALIDGEAMINFGGQILVRSAREVSVADPADRDKPVLALTLDDASLSTSAGSHILDPRTGRSCGERGSVSVIAERALEADILSTALYVMGEEEGLRWAAAAGVAAIFIDTNQTIRLSPAARKLGVAVLDRDFSVKE